MENKKITDEILKKYGFKKTLIEIEDKFTKYHCFTNDELSKRITIKLKKFRCKILSVKYFVDGLEIKINNRQKYYCNFLTIFFWTIEEKILIII